MQLNRNKTLRLSVIRPSQYFFTSARKWLSISVREQVYLHVREGFPVWLHFGYGCLAYVFYDPDYAPPMLPRAFF
jgi:hypothetical protein